MSAADGTRVSGWEHLSQSILDILMTYPGERIMRPEYGSRVRDLIDRPINAQWLADLYFEVVYAIQRWEPRVGVLKVGASMTQPGHRTIELTVYVGDMSRINQLAITLDW